MRRLARRRPRLSASPASTCAGRACASAASRPRAGRVDDEAVIGLPLFTGSEEGRGPLYDETGVPFEDRRRPVASTPQGHKIPVPRRATSPTPCR